MLDPAIAEKLREQLQRCENLPSLSAVALEVLNLIRQDNASLRELAEVISQDPALATKVLRTVNSSFYGLAKKIKTIHHATVVLGMSAVKSLALSFSLVKTIDGADGGTQFNFRQFWTDSLTRGVAAKKLSATVAPDLADEAFVASLLSHIGILAIHTLAAVEYEKVLSALEFEGGTIDEWERKILGFTHSDCGGELGVVWKLPEELVLAIRHHDDISEMEARDTRTIQLVSVVHEASLIARCFMGTGKTAALKEATTFAEQTWGIDSEQLDLLLNDVKGDVETAADLFDVAIEDTCSYDQILQIANAEMAKLLMAASQGGGQAQADEGQLDELQQQREELEQRAERLEKLAYRDSLTGLYNMRALGEQLDHLFAQARVTGRPLGVIFFDMDGFKKVNDTLGHDAANEVLCDLAAMITSELRSADVLCRYGGDEFAILLPEITPQAIQAVAERLRHSVANNVFQLPAGQARVTLSIGVSMFDGAGNYRNGEELLQASDRSMYQSKRAGKNRVTCADSVPVHH